MPLTTTRRLPCPQAVARKELIVASRKARVSANAAAHNARVSDVHDVAALVESQVTQYRRSSIDRRLEVRYPRHLSLFLALTFQRIDETAIRTQPRAFQKTAPLLEKKELRI